MRACSRPIYENFGKYAKCFLFLGIENENDFAKFIKQPAVLAGIAVAVFIIIFLIGIFCWLKKSKRFCKSRSSFGEFFGCENCFLFQ